MTIVSPVFVWMFGAEHLLEKYTLMDLIGLRTPGIFVKIFIIVQKRNQNDSFLRSDPSLCPTSIVDNDSVPWTYCNVTIRRE